ncbi:MULTISPECIES: hypothetical protein [Sphingobacterium]|uniref:hypothetical protein n=1 Tax=Sphingobacterium TaxID=28453 RepID=UPI00257C1E3D|nr:MULTISPECIES: hypothetical protein [Sphingobacterium]
MSNSTVPEEKKYDSSIAHFASLSNEILTKESTTNLGVKSANFSARHNFLLPILTPYSQNQKKIKA